jgi:hypothetical protein
MFFSDQRPSDAMPASDSSSPPTEDRSVVDRLIDWIVTGVKGLFGVACLSKGGVIGLLAMLALEENPYWALGLGSVSVACLALGGWILFRLAADDAEQDRTGFMRLVDELAGLISWGMWGAVSLVSVLYVSGFLLAAGYLGSWALRVYRDSGIGGPFLLVAGMTLLFMVVPGKFALAQWRQWRTSRLSYADNPGDVRRTWAGPELQTSGLPLRVDILGGVLSQTVRSWPRVIAGVVATWGATGLVLVYAPTFAFQLFSLPIAAGGAYSTLLLYEGLRHRRRYGQAAFEMAPFPAPLDGRLQGLVDTGVPLADRPPDGFHVVLSCYEQRSRKNLKTLWYTEAQCPGKPTANSTLAVRVDFELPEGQPPASLQPMPSGVIWRLELRCDALDPRYEQSLDVPIYPADALD